MIRAGFLDPESREDLIELARDGSAAHRLARRANAVLLLDDGMTCEATARVLFIDDDTIRTWYQDYLEDGIEGLTNFGHEGGSCRLTAEQQDKLKVWIAAALPRTTREVGACSSPRDVTHGSPVHPQCGHMNPPGQRKRRIYSRQAASPRNHSSTS